MKKLIAILMMVSLPAMAITPTDARKLLKSHGIDPTVIADLSGGTMDEAVDALKIGYGQVGSGILNTGTTGTFSDYGDSWWGGTNDAVRFTHSNGDEIGFGYISNNNNVVRYQPADTLGSTFEIFRTFEGDQYELGSYETFVHVDRDGVGTDLFDGSDSVVGSIGVDIAEAIRNKAIALKPAIKNMALQTTASALGQTAFTECANSPSSTLCVSVGSQFQTIAGQINVEDAYYLYNGQNHYWNPETSRYATVNANGDFNGGSSESVLISKGAVWVPSSSTTQANEYNDDLMEIQGLSEIMNTNTFEDLYQ